MSDIPGVDEKWLREHAEAWFMVGFACGALIVGLAMWVLR